MVDLGGTNTPPVPAAISLKGPAQMEAGAMPKVDPEALNAALFEADRALAADRPGEGEPPRPTRRSWRMTPGCCGRAGDDRRPGGDPAALAENTAPLHGSRPAAAWPARGTSAIPTAS